MLEASILPLLVIGAIPYSLFTVTFLLRTRWWLTPAGRALMVSTPAVALVLLEEIAFAFLPVSYRVELIATFVLLVLIAAGGWLKFGALVYELRRGNRSHLDE